MKKTEFKQILSNKNYLTYLVKNNLLNFDLVIAELNKGYIIEYAQNISYLLENNIIDWKEIENITVASYFYYFARYNPNAPIDMLADFTIATKNAEKIYYFARDIKNAPIEKLADAVIATNNAEYIFCFIRDIKNILPNILTFVTTNIHISSGTIIFLNQLLEMKELLKDEKQEIVQETIIQIYQELINKNGNNDKEISYLKTIQKNTTHPLLLTIINNYLKEKELDLYLEFTSEFDKENYQVLELKRTQYKEYFSKIEEE